MTADPVLRQQLADAFAERGYGKPGAKYIVDGIWPLIEAWGDARVAETAEQIAAKIEAEIPYEPMRAREGLLRLAALARSVPGTTP